MNKGAMTGSSDEGMDGWWNKLSDDEVEKGEKAMKDEGEVRPQGGEGDWWRDGGVEGTGVQSGF